MLTILVLSFLAFEQFETYHYCHARVLKLPPFFEDRIRDLAWITGYFSQSGLVLGSDDWGGLWNFKRGLTLGNGGG